MGDGLKRARDAARATRGLPPETPKLAEIAERIAAHLRRFEASPAINAPRDGRRINAYHNPSAFVRGSRIGVGYVSFQSETCLTKPEALAYLAWLDAGNVGRHFEQQRAAQGGAL